MRTKYKSTFDLKRSSILSDVVTADIHKHLNQGKTYEEAVNEVEQSYKNSPYYEILKIPLLTYKQLLDKSNAKQQAELANWQTIADQFPTAKAPVHPSIQQTLDRITEHVLSQESPATHDLAAKFLHNAFEQFKRHLPPFLSSPSTGATTSVPLLDTLRDAREAIHHLVHPFQMYPYPEVGGTCILFPIRRIMNGNINRVWDGGHNPNYKINDVRRCGASVSEFVEDILQNTPFHAFLLMRVPFAIPDNIRFEHTHILGGSGHGKTTLLTHQFLQDVHSPVSLIVIDGKGTLVKELQRFKCFEGSDRIVILNPQDSLFPPALNMFAAPIRQGLPEEVTRQIENSAIANFEYIFDAKDFKLTAKQATCLSYCVRLLFSMKPTPTIHTLLDLMAEKVERTGGIPANSRFKPFIERQPAIVRRFFTDLFYHPTEYGETKRQIQNRIFDLLENPAFSAMFSTTECKLDLFDIIQNRKILLVDSSPSALGEKAAPLLGRYIIALALSSAYARLTIPKAQWTPAYIVIDEAQMFVDEEKTQPLLQQAREFNLGIVLAHQKLADLTPTLTATFAANTSIRYAGGVSAQDASFMAKNMNCEPDFIMGQRKTADSTTFACYVRGYTEHPVPLSVGLGALDNEPKMSAAAYDALIAQNRKRVASSPEASKPIPSIRPEPVALEPTADTHADHGDAGEPATKW